MTADVELLPCPFCGGKIEGNVSEGSTFRWRKVDGCCADGPEVRHNTTAPDQGIAEHESRIAAIKAWNTRAATAAQAAEIEALRAEVERLQEIVRPKREEECLTLDHWRMRAYDLEANWSRCSRACADEQTKRIKAEDRAERLAEALRQIASQGPHYGPDGTRETWRHWADIARAALDQEAGRG